MKYGHFHGEQKKNGEGGQRGKRAPAVFLIMALVLFIVPAAGAQTLTAAGTVISNQAFVDYKDANGNALLRVFSNTVTTEVSQVGGVEVTPESETKTAAQGTSVSFDAVITNTGNGDDVFALAVSTACPGGSVTLYEDTNQNGVRDAGEDTVVSSTGSLPAAPPDNDYHMIVVVDIPAGTANGTTCDTTLTATSQFDGNVADVAVYTSEVQDAVIEFTKSADTSAGSKPGDTITYAIQGRNVGTATAENVGITDLIPANTTYVPGSMRQGSIGGTYDTAIQMTDTNTDGDGADFNLTAAGAVTVVWGDAPPLPDPSGSGIVYFQVSVNPDVSAGTTISNVATVDYEIGGNAQTPLNSTTAAFQVEALAGVLVDPDRTGTSDPGDQLVYALTVTNQGNGSDIIDLTYNSSAGWTWVLWADVDGDGTPGTDGDFVLTDSDGDAVPDTRFLPGGASLSILAVATIPAGTSDGTVDTTTITGTSTVDTGVLDPAALTTTVAAPVLGLTKSVNPAGPQPPGTELTYTMTVTNSGTGTATSVVITDVIPLNTTYKADSIRTGSSLASLTNRTDAQDGDGAEYNTGSNSIVIPDGSSLNLGLGGTWVVQFTVTIN